MYWNNQFMCRKNIDIDDLKNAAYLAKSLSDSNRLRILLYLSHEKRSVSDIVHGLNLSQPLVSHHLKELKHCLLVNVHREGPFVYYQVSDPGILELVDALSEMSTSLLTSKRNF